MGFSPPPLDSKLFHSHVYNVDPDDTVRNESFHQNLCCLQFCFGF